jgi:hypothetical protein
MRGGVEWGERVRGRDIWNYDNGMLGRVSTGASD